MSDNTISSCEVEDEEVTACNVCVTEPHFRTNNNNDKGNTFGKAKMSTVYVNLLENYAF
jgi:hypothetical protein